jgi:hypothetical protein
MTCKESPRTPNGARDWCGAWKLKKSSADQFKAEKLAIKFCEQYGYITGTEEYEIAICAFTVAYRMEK